MFFRLLMLNSTKATLVLLLLTLPTQALANHTPGHTGGGGGGGTSPLEERVIELENLVEALLDRLNGVTRGVDPNTGKDTITFSGINVQIVNGSGLTNVTDGAGNLIIGYNVLRGSADDRSGSHMLVIGDRNNYTVNSFGGMVIGRDNQTSAAFASVSGGSANIASGPSSSVSGGSQNTASASGASVSGGDLNTASGDASSASGGHSNRAMTNFASISGGINNVAKGTYSSVSGGIYNTATVTYQSDVNTVHAHIQNDLFKTPPC